MRLCTPAFSLKTITLLLLGWSVVISIGILAVAWLKTATFGYNALDLGIYRQVLAETAAGRWFALTIHPHSYLGDHVEPLLLPLAALYRLVPSIATLLVAQTVALLGGAWLAVRRARRILPKGATALFGFSVLGSFLLHNVALFEFHALAFAVPLALLALAAYERGAFGWFLASLALLFLVREDVGLLGLGFGVLAWADRRPWRWRILPALLGLLWLFLGMAVTSAFNADGYKFLAYLRWLGDTPQEMLLHALTQPWRVVLHLLRPQNLLFVSVLLLATAALPLFAPRALLPALPSLLTLFLTASGGNDVALESHYPAVFLPFLWWSAMDGLRRLTMRPPRFLLARFERPAAVALLVLLTVTLYGFWTQSPLRPAAWLPAAARVYDPATSIANEFARSVDKRARVAASYAFLPNLADREELYSIHYLYAGHRQLSALPYTVPDAVDTVLFDTRDAILYDVQFRNDARVGTHGADRLRRFLERFRVVDALDSFLLLRRTGDAGTPLVATDAALPYRRTEEAGPLRLVATSADGAVPLHVERRVVDGVALPTVELGMTWQIAQPTTETYHYRLEIVDGAGVVAHARDYPFAAGVFPTPQWDTGEPVTFTARWALPTTLSGAYTIRMVPFTVDGYLTLDALRSAALKETRRFVQRPIVLGTVSL